MKKHPLRSNPKRGHLKLTHTIYWRHSRAEEKDFYRNAADKQLQVGDVVVVDAIKGYDIGVVSVCGELAKIQVAKKRKNFKPLEAKKIIRLADNNIKIIAGGGVNIDNIELLYKLGVREFHLSGTLKNNNKHLETSYEIIRNVVKKLRSINNQKLY